MILGCALIGFTDDYLKLRKRHSLGLPGRWKMVGLALVTVGAALLLNESSTFSTDVYVPIVDWTLDLSWGYYVLLFLLIAGTVNGANLTDGVDGLAAGVVVIMLLTFLAVAGIGWIRSGDPGARSDTLLDIATLAAALIGGTIGFLWYNAFPAEVMMGDTGSFALGGAIAGVRGGHGHEILLPLIAGIFVIEVMSLIIQVVSFKRTGQARLPDSADPPPLRDEGVVRDEDHGALLGRLRDLLRLGFALFYRDFLQFVSRDMSASSSPAGAFSSSASRARVRRRPRRCSTRAPTSSPSPSRRRLPREGSASVASKSRWDRGGDAGTGDRSRHQEPRSPGRRAAGRGARARVFRSGEIELGARLLPNPIVGVTGTNGRRRRRRFSARCSAPTVGRSRSRATSAAR